MLLKFVLMLKKSDIRKITYLFFFVRDYGIKLFDCKHCDFLKSTPLIRDLDGKIGIDRKTFLYDLNTLMLSSDIDRFEESFIVVFIFDLKTRPT